MKKIDPVYVNKPAFCLCILMFMLGGVSHLKVLSLPYPLPDLPSRTIVHLGWMSMYSQWWVFFSSFFFFPYISDLKSTRSGLSETYQSFLSFLLLGRRKGISCNFCSVTVAVKLCFFFFFYIFPYIPLSLNFFFGTFGQRDARKLGKLRRINEITDPYNMEEMVMPLHDFINDPVAHEIVHNGATFQVY